MRKTDIQVFRGSRPAHTIAHKVQTQKTVNCRNNSKVFKAPISMQESESSDKARKDKKKKQHKDKKDSRNFNTPTSEVNVIEVGDKKQKKKKKRDVSKITYYNFNKLRHYADQCPESWRPKN